MIHRTVRRTLAAALVSLAAAGCSEQPTQVDPTYVLPEGRPNQSFLVTWYDLPTSVRVYRDLAPPGRNAGDTLITIVEQRRATPSTIYGHIFDDTDASGYQILRRETGGGFRQFQDFMAARTKTWLDSKWELYRFSDPSPADFSPPTYVGRGLELGIVNARSPLTNVAEVMQPDMAPINITQPPIRIVGRPREPADSLFNIAWDPITGASGYVIQVYEFRNDLRSVSERILSGTPAPIYDGQSRDVLVAILDGTGPTSYRIGDVRSDVTVLTRRTTFFGVVYQVRVSAFDSRGRMIATSPGDSDIQQGFFGDGTYGLYPLGAALVSPRIPVLLQAPDEGGLSRR